MLARLSALRGSDKIRKPSEDQLFYDHVFFHLVEPKLNRQPNFRWDKCVIVNVGPKLQCLVGKRIPYVSGTHFRVS